MPTNPIRALIWDLGGVLVDWDPRYLYRQLLPDDAAIQAFLDEIEFSAWNREQDRGRTFADAVVEHSARFPHHAHLIRAYHERYAETLGGPIAPNVELLTEFHRAGFPLYALTNWGADTFVTARELYPFLQWFQTIIVSGEVQLIKPDPEIFTLLLETIDRPAAECLFIDDNAENIAAAQSLGFQTIHYKSPAQLRAELSQFQTL